MPAARVGPLGVEDLAGAVSRIDMSLEPEYLNRNGEETPTDEGRDVDQHVHRSLSFNGQKLEKTEKSKIGVVNTRFLKNQFRRRFASKFQFELFQFY